MMTEPELKPPTLVLRLNPELYSAIATLAGVHNRSMNGEICTALEKWLYEQESMLIVRDKLVSSVTADVQKSIAASIPVFKLQQDKDADTTKLTLRYNEPIRRDLLEAASDYKAESGEFLSQNYFVQMILVWWLVFNYELHEYTRAVYQDFQSKRVSRPTAQVHRLKSLIA
jgi:hypothetical protein